MDNFCIKCGNKLSEKDKFCIKCGYKISNIYDDIAETIAKIIEGKQNEFDKLYSLTCNYVFNAIRYMGINPPDTEDIMQETYIKISKNIATIKDTQSGYKWIKQIAVNTAKTWLRKNIKENTIDTDKDYVLDENSEIEDKIYVPEDIYDNKERQTIFIELLKQLPEKQKTILAMHTYNELKLSEISEILKMPLNSVKTNLARGKKALAEIVVKYEKDNKITLRSAAPIPFFLWLFTKDAIASECPYVAENLLGDCINEINNNLSSTCGKNNLANTTNKPVKTNKNHIIRKIVIGIVSVVVLFFAANEIYYQVISNYINNGGYSDNSGIIDGILSGSSNSNSNNKKYIENVLKKVEESYNNKDFEGIIECYPTEIQQTYEKYKQSWFGDNDDSRDDSNSVFTAFCTIRDNGKDIPDKVTIKIESIDCNTSTATAKCKFIYNGNEDDYEDKEVTLVYQRGCWKVSSYNCGLRTTDDLGF